MRVLYFDCFSGASGDMILGALLDAGAPETSVRQALDALGLQGWELHVGETRKGSLRATKATVTVTDTSASRAYAEIRSLLEGAPLPADVAERAQDIFLRLAEAEGKVHGIAPEDVHFHEVGSLDAIVDVVGAAAALVSIGAERVVVSPVTTGRGITRGAHGPIPVPAPAVLELLRGAPLVERGEDELVTPTGAAILAAAADRFGPMPPLRPGAVGYGAGTRDAEIPNVLRVVVGEGEEPYGDARTLVETNLDDMAPELVPYAIDRLLDAGADDAWTTPIVMKKGRPALTLSVLVPPASLDAILDVLYRETTTLGVRLRGVGKDELERESVQVEVEGYPVRVKVARRAGTITNAAPEFEDASKVARVTGLSLKDVYARALAAYRDQI